MTGMDQWLSSAAQSFKIREVQVQSILHLAADKCTVPFIVRYRKEQTGGLREDIVRGVLRSFQQFQCIRDRKASILSKLAEQPGVLTPDLQLAVDNCQTLLELEDLYAPFKSSKQTKAAAAVGQGLQPVVDKILNGSISSDADYKTLLKQIAAAKDLSVSSADEGVVEILAEYIARQLDVRRALKDHIAQRGQLSTSKRRASSADDQHPKRGQSSDADKYKQYFTFQSAFSSIKDHQILAINRGERDKHLSVGAQIDKGQCIRLMTATLRTSSNINRRGHLLTVVKTAIDLCYTKRLRPAVVRELRRELTSRATNSSIAAFSRNLKCTLLQRPVRNTSVLAIDPSFRTGCKLALLDRLGNFTPFHEGMAYTIYPNPPRNETKEATAVILRVLELFTVDLIAVGNGTACHETLTFLEKVIQDSKHSIRKSDRSLSWCVVPETGASVYSVSAVAQDEFPTLPPEVRSAISIGRRVQDPLSELIKIDPKSLGVGMYQHDIKSKALDEALDDVVETCVNDVGADINVASTELLRRISGLSAAQAQRIVEQRQTRKFKSRAEILKVTSIGAKTYEQCCGFLRVYGGAEPLDETSVHPECYDAAKALLSAVRVGTDWRASKPSAFSVKFTALTAKLDLKTLAKQLDISEVLLQDLVDSLSHVGVDPRRTYPSPQFRSRLLTYRDLSQGMAVKGSVRNVVDFGAFVDIGMKDDALLPRSHMQRLAVQPTVGQILDVVIMDFDEKRGRISCSVGQTTDGGDRSAATPHPTHRKRKRSTHVDERRRSDTSQNYNGKRDEHGRSDKSHKSSRRRKHSDEKHGYSKRARTTSSSERPRSRERSRMSHSPAAHQSDSNSGVSTLFVGGVPRDWNDDDLHEFCSRSLPVFSAQIARDRASQRPRGFGFVNVASGNPSEALRLLSARKTDSGRALNFQLKK